MKLKHVFLIISLVMISTVQSEAQMLVHKWHNGFPAAFSLSFDDGTKSHYEDLRPILNKFNLKATFYLNTSLVSDLPVENAHSGSWEEFKTMAGEGHEIGSHGVNHPDLTSLEMGDSLTKNTMVYELSESKKVIEQKIGNGYQCLTHAYPFCRNDATVREITAIYYESARSCGTMFNESTPEYMAMNSIGYGWPSERNSFIADFKNLNTFFNAIENSVIVKGGWGMLLAHEVLPFAELKEAGTWQPTSSEWMLEASKWMRKKMNQGQLWIGTAADVTRYAKERDAFYADKIFESADTLLYLVGDSLDNAIYNFPLSVDIEVPSNWKMVRVIQGDHLQNYTADAEDSPHIKAQILPLEDTVFLFNLPDNQLLVESATIPEPGNELLISFNKPVVLSDTSYAGITVFINQNDTAEVNSLYYLDSDSLELKLGLAETIYAGTLVNISIEDSEIYSTSMSPLGNETSISALNNSKLVEDEYKSLYASTGIILQDDQVADVEFYVFSTSAYTLDLQSGWSALSKTTGLEYDTIQVYFDENLSTTDRSDTIYIQSEDGFEEIIILSQLGSDPLDIEQKINEDKFRLFPSPASDIINLVIPEHSRLPASLTLLSINGQKLRTMTLHEYQVSINVEELNPGLYIMQLTSGGSQWEERFIVQ